MEDGPSPCVNRTSSAGTRPEEDRAVRKRKEIHVSLVPGALVGYNLSAMIHWIAFDDETAEAVVSRFRRGAAEIHPGTTALDSALTAGHPSLLLLPSDTPGRVVVARVCPKTELPPKPQSIQVPARHQPQSQTPAKKNWWQRRTA